MSIRIRVIDGATVALCAARSVEKPGDLYLDDAAHHALTQKFATDFASEGLMIRPRVDLDAPRREQEESNNPNRELPGRLDAFVVVPECAGRICG